MDQVVLELARSVRDLPDAAAARADRTSVAQREGTDHSEFGWEDPVVSDETGLLPVEILPGCLWESRTLSHILARAGREAAEASRC